MPGDPKPPLRARRDARSRRFHASRERRAVNPLAAVARVFDRWRRGVSRLPPKYAQAEIEEVAAYLRDRARGLEPNQEEDRNDGR